MLKVLSHFVGIGVLHIHMQGHLGTQMTKARVHE
jgi:hypothetical protein